MIKTRCLTKNIPASDTEAIDAFINEFLENYQIETILKTACHLDQEYISVSVIFKEEVIDVEETRGYLKQIVKMKSPLSINAVQTELSVGFNHASRLLTILEDLGILASKKAGRWLLKSESEACRLIDEWTA